MILIGILLWPLMILLNIILYIMGWILVPIAATFKAYDRSYDVGKEMKGENPLVYHFTWRFMWLWDNWEDGIANDMYWKAPNMFLQILYWSCSRNPVNNLRLVPYLSVRIDPERVRFVGSLIARTDSWNDWDTHWMAVTKLYDTKMTQWFFAWQGLYSNFYWQFNMSNKLYRFWIGWKIFPTDVFGVTPYRRNGAGFALQFKEIK